MGQIIPAFSRETREAIHAHGVRSDPRRYGPPTGCSHFFRTTIPEWGATRKAIQGTMRAIISIHAPRVGSDTHPTMWAASICDFYPRSPRGERPAARVNANLSQDISIHAPRVGSDGTVTVGAGLSGAFLSTLPAWGATATPAITTARTKNFYPRSPRGERPFGLRAVTAVSQFLSTLPAWGATIGLSSKDD